MELKNIIAGIISIIIGIYVIYFTNKNTDAQLPVSTALKGYIGGVVFIICGIMFILGEMSISDF